MFIRLRLRVHLGSLSPWQLTPQLAISNVHVVLSEELISETTCIFLYMDIFGKNVYVTFFVVVFVISFHVDYVGWQGDFNVAIYNLVQ